MFISKSPKAYKHTIHLIYFVKKKVFLYCVGKDDVDECFEKLSLHPVLGRLAQAIAAFRVCS